MRFLRNTDWLMLGSAILVSLAGLISMYSFGGKSAFAEHQLIWLSLGIILFFFLSGIDFHFLRRTGVVVAIYAFSVLFLLLLFVIGSKFNGARGWFNVGAFAIQPVDIAELSLILVLAKYFSRRHIEIAHFRHIIVSGAYMFFVFVLLFLQPDFGSAVIIAFLWVAVVLIAGIPLRRLALLIGLGAAAAALLWVFAFAPYQKARILTFLHPLADISGAGYNAFQSTVAVGSGGIFGKGIGYGTQSRLQFLPEHETDFIFASFAEEWGLIGTLILFSIYGVLLYRLIQNGRQGATNFEVLFALGAAALFLIHAIINIGMNVGLLPVTGVTLPFMSYGGSHIVTSYAMLGIVNAMRKYGHAGQERGRQELAGLSLS
ncbi:MAG: rod shape-determining protein RodA [Patescibacteria group bacterium]|nr:rod shape-determining protein RodA [Patescibacteria group bacterium]